MKIRWTRRTLRLRLDDLESAALQRGETLRERIHFPGGDWSVELRGAQESELGMRDGVLQVTLDEDELRLFARQREDGIEREGQPRLLVEQERRPDDRSQEGSPA
ncbi:DUF7009 family protein [Deinococcus peraridilitoris]|uniref:Uncharacterized protein n=1 Tax=Deinococcus peraridilitoris (strain DSM 19664 / LMG 22246 / CIP 109416 / KR-200) TaxID=937777 RepID=L0A2T0_DEIPD|nr:hypothetical protein [Deinococcus peraridilitoris]AFZ68131.1 hypothetical protein Deipe_2666 [Deinococcus peraridilitoris DSM 19664]